MNLVTEPGIADTFPLFPGELDSGIKLSQDETLALSATYSELYHIYIYRLSAELEDLYSLNKLAARIIARRALVPLVHCFFDRLVRINRAIKLSTEELAAPQQTDIATPDSIEVFEQNAIESPEFNQFMIKVLGPVWDMPASDPVNVPGLYKQQVGFTNNLFTLYGKNYYHRMKKAVLRLLAHIPKSRYPALTMCNSRDTFLYHGFYYRFIEDVTPKWQLKVGDIDKSLRSSLFTSDYVESDVLTSFLSNLGLDKKESDRAKIIFVKYLQDNIPASLLESIPDNMLSANASLSKFKKKVLFTSSGRCSRSTYVTAVAKQKGFRIVDMQHGGHYGYLKDVSVILELEYPDIDQFISWGWSRLPEHKEYSSLSVTSLPSPWLSERKRYWENLSDRSNKQYDILLMPNMVKRFTGAPQGASSSRIDLIHEMSEFLVSIVREATENGISILHKPYNTTTTGLLSKTLQEMEKIGGPLYVCEQQLDKGLTIELLERCNIIVWDQPGTGFLECLTSSIPTIIHWPRTYCEEEDWLIDVFSDLENVGIIHRDVKTLIKEIKSYKKSPDSWMNNPHRVSVVNDFCKKYAWASDNWPDYWDKYMDVVHH